MHSLFNVLNLTEWDIISRGVMDHQPGMVLFLTLFLWLTAYGLMQVIIGVMVEHTLMASAAMEKEHEAQHRKGRMQIIHEIHDMLRMTDADGDNHISYDELEYGLTESPELSDLFERVNLPENFT